MRHALPVATLLAAVQLGGAAAAAEFVDTVPQALRSVVHIAIGTRKPGTEPFIGDAPSVEASIYPGFRGARVAGSGLVIDADGHIISTANLFESGDAFQVRLSDGRLLPGRLVGRDKRTDIALIKVDASGLPAAKIGDARRLRLAERVVAMGGMPAGIDATVTDGIVSLLSRPADGMAGFIQTTVALYPSMGGGPLVNQNGEVVGINTVIYEYRSGRSISFAVPIQDAMAVVSELRIHGRVRRSTLGVTLQEVTPEIAQLYGLSAPTGALVNSLRKDSPAAKASIAQGDIILRMGNETVRGARDVIRIVASMKPGSRVGVEVLRTKNARPEKLEVELGEAAD